MQGWLNVRAFVALRFSFSLALIDPFTDHLHVITKVLFSFTVLDNTWHLDAKAHFVVVECSVQSLAMGSGRPANEVLSFDCLMVLTLNLYRSTSSGLRAYHYFLTLALGDTLILATSVLCLFVGLNDRIHLDFGQRSVLEFCQHLSLRLAFRDQILLLRLLVAFSVASTAEDHVITIVRPRPLDVFAAQGEMLAVYLLTLPRSLF